MEFRLLRSFLIVAEELNIGRAAKRLFIAQPPLSKQIQQLEDELGCKLFERIPKGLNLTPEGEIFVIEAKKVKLAIEQAAAAVCKSNQGSLGKIHIGFSGALPSVVLPKLFNQTKKFYPNIDFEIHRKANSNLVLESVANGDLDAGMVLLPISTLGISYTIISRHRLIAAVPVTHPLASRKFINVSELRDEKFITNHAYKGSVIREVFIHACQEAGFNPRIVKEADDTHSILILVAANYGITLTLEGLENIQLDEIRYIPLEDNHTFIDLAVVWREGNPSILLKNALSTLS
ncbi:LysR substrate-binding domain-containing protein [Acinetobacter sp. KS-LM10]|uniref:LysR substrate-binding domain-containing protein n=1 Tax=Acinetobacter sp. KS-LM10 TaxID=3120518 RepID=UPI0030CD34D4